MISGVWDPDQFLFFWCSSCTCHSFIHVLNRKSHAGGQILQAAVCGWWGVARSGFRPRGRWGRYVVANLARVRYRRTDRDQAGASPCSCLEASSARTYVLRRTDGSTNKPFLYKEREPLKVGTTSNLRFLKSTPSVWTPAADAMLYFAVILISLGAVLIILAILVITKRIKLWV